MANRQSDWLRQAARDLEAARSTCKDKLHDWACFASHQAAEKALKALYQFHHAEGWGHTLRVLIQELEPDEPGLARYQETAKTLDKYYIPTRYPNGLEDGAPADTYTQKEADEAIDYAQQIVEFCQARCGAQGRG
jgi:HEPN domain-containing protein